MSDSSSRPSFENNTAATQSGDGRGADGLAVKAKCAPLVPKVLSLGRKPTLIGVSFQAMTARCKIRQEQTPPSVGCMAFAPLWAD